jgi:hypothetical protein
MRKRFRKGPARVSKDEGGHGAGPLMLRDASQRSRAGETSVLVSRCDAPQHEGEGRGVFSPNEPKTILAIRVVPAKAGTHDHRGWLWVPALAALGRDDNGLVRANNQPAAAGNDCRLAVPVSGLFFTGNGATPTCRAVSARGDSDHALGGVGSAERVANLRQSASGRRFQFVQAPAPTDPNELWRPRLHHRQGTKKPPAGCPAGGRQLKSSREHQGTMSRWTRMRSP